MAGSAHIEVEFRQAAKFGQHVAGDVFLSRRIKEEERVIAVLSDGLGSGVKANVLATLTATMGLAYTAGFADLRRSAETIMDTLPVCSVRKISYSTFTMVDIAGDGRVRIVEHGNPPFLLLRRGEPVTVPEETIALPRWRDRPLASSEFQLLLGDRLVLFTDGITQSGMGQRAFPLGWGPEQAVQHVCSLVEDDPEINAGRLAQALVERAQANDRGRAKDDTSCAVLSYRSPRHLLVLTGPPFSRERDAELAELVRSHPGSLAICGGTTASIISRQLGLPVRMELTQLDPSIPPRSRMAGVELVTEGTLTLARVAEELEAGASGERLEPNAAGELLGLMLDSDIIEFVVGTRINEAHQDPSIPQELGLRRNIVKKIAGLLETRHLKQVSVRLV